MHEHFLDLQAGFYDLKDDEVSAESQKITKVSSRSFGEERSRPSNLADADIYYRIHEPSSRSTFIKFRHDNPDRDVEPLIVDFVLVDCRDLVLSIR